MPKFAKLVFDQAKLNRAHKACRAGRADIRQQAIEALRSKVQDLAETAEPDAVHTDAFGFDGVMILHIEVTDNGTVHVGAFIPADFVFSGIDEELRPFAIAEKATPLASGS